jgi:hypothetical protein
MSPTNGDVVHMPKRDDKRATPRPAVVLRDLGDEVYEVKVCDEPGPRVVFAEELLGFAVQVRAA